MTTWIDHYLETHPDFTKRAVLLRAESATHLQLAPGLARAVITGARQYTRAESGGWQALDLMLLSDGKGKLGAAGLAARIQPDGTVIIDGHTYQQKTLSVGTLSGGRYGKLTELPRGRPQGARLLRETGIYSTSSS